jgi:uncharacterized protein YfaT (DUF1175 family)
LALILLFLVSVYSDQDRDGFPDTSELRSGRDRYAFREWFCAVALSQYLYPTGEVKDCGDLVRFSYREALKRHDDRWFNRSGVKIKTAIPEIACFHYPEVPLLGTKIFRVKSGPFISDDLATGVFSNFADVKNLLLYNTTFLSKEPNELKNGDLLFFFQHEDQSYHLMIYFIREGKEYLLYHTGPADTTRGELRLIEYKTLENFPVGKWRPFPRNPAFLGFYRFKILE